MTLTPVHDVKKEIEIKGLGKITISHCSLGDMENAFRAESTDVKRFTLSLLSRVIRKPEYTIDRLSTLPDDIIESIAREWLNYGDCYLKYFKQIDQCEELSFYNKFKQTMEAPYRELLKKLFPSFEELDHVRKEFVKLYTPISMQFQSAARNISSIQLGIFSEIDSVFRTQQKIQELTKPLLKMTESQQSIFELSKSWTQEIDRIKKGIDGTFLSTNIITNSMTHFQSLKLDRLKNTLQKKQWIKVQQSMLDISKTYSSFADNVVRALQSVEMVKPCLPSLKLEIPRINLEIGSLIYRNAVRIISIPSEEKSQGKYYYETEINEFEEGVSFKTLPDLLGAWNSDWKRIHSGCWNAFYSKNPDKIRQACCSIRELLRDILHTLAPDEDIKDWYFRSQGKKIEKVTRRCRFEFVLSNATIGLDDFANKTTEYGLFLYEELQKGTHTISYKNISLVEKLLKMTEGLIITILINRERKK